MSSRPSSPPPPWAQRAIGFQGPSSPPPPWAQRAIGFQGPFFEMETTTPGTPKARRFRSQKGGAANIAVTARVRHISPPPFLTDRREGDHRYTSGEFTSILEGASGEDQNPVSIHPSSIHPSSSKSQQSAPSSPEMSSFSSSPSSPPPPEVNQAINLHRELLKVPVTGTASSAFRRSISPPPFFEMDDRRVGAVLASRYQGHRLQDRRHKSGEFTSRIERPVRGRVEDAVTPIVQPIQPVTPQQLLKRHPVPSESQQSAPSSPEMSCPSSSPPPEVKHASDLYSEPPKVQTAGTTRLVSERSISPPPFFEMDDRRVGAVLASRHHGHRLEERRSKSGKFASISEGVTGEDPRSGSSNPVTSQYDVAVGNNSISLAKRPPVPQKRQTKVGFTARLEAQRPSSPPPAKKNGLIASIFKRKKQMETFHGFVEGEAAHFQNKPTINNEPRPTNLGLARIFSYEELIHSTNNFRQELADGGFSRVYLGKLRDERKVAVKVLFEGIPKRMEQFLNEVTVLSRLRHKNLVSLYGCTDPETQKLLLVYEFVPNGTISDHLHRQLPPLTWAVRMQIAIETAEALAYLHSRDPPIIHRDVKTSNILLDNEFHVKVADLGMCRLVPWDTSTISTQPQGTLGFRDPESDLYCILTEKSDVYSFGVVLLELISAQQAVDVNRERNDIYLFNMALRKISNNELESLVDPKLAYHSNSEIRRMVDLMAELACCCLQQEGYSRPPMEEVLTALKAIRDGVQ